MRPPPYCKPPFRARPAAVGGLDPPPGRTDSPTAGPRHSDYPHDPSTSITGSKSIRDRGALSIRPVYEGLHAVAPVEKLLPSVNGSLASS